jgi:hypothetical protein
MLASRPRVVKNGVQLSLMSEGTWVDTGLALIAGAKCSYEIWIAQLPTNSNCSWKIKSRAKHNLKENSRQMLIGGFS